MHYENQHFLIYKPMKTEDIFIDVMKKKSYIYMYVCVSKKG